MHQDKEKLLPSGVKSPQVTLLPWPINVLSKAALSVFHIQMLKSSEPAKSLCPLGSHLSHWKISWHLT